MKFTKMQGDGNDYVYVDCTNSTLLNESELAVKVSDRHFGIGSDGLILIKKGINADFEMVMYNADGSRSEMCGNGIRCVAKYCYDKGLIKKSDFTIESMGRVKRIKCTVNDGSVSSVTVDMGAPILDVQKIPVEIKSKQAIGVPISVQNTNYNMTCVSMGNPHAVVFLSENPSNFSISEIGPVFEHHSFFPKKTNAEFVFAESRTSIIMRVWERGTGETLACGTGACAAAVAAILNGFADKGKDINVHLLGGDLTINWSGNENESVYMTGPAVTVFEGEYLEENY